MRMQFAVSAASYPVSGSAGESGPEQLLALLATLAALGLRLAEELSELRVAGPFSVIDEHLKAHDIAQARLSEPNDVVVLICGTGGVPVSVSIDPSVMATPRLVTMTLPTQPS